MPLLIQIPQTGNGNKEGTLTGPPTIMGRMKHGGKPLVELPYVAVDVETTGLAPSDGHRVCEIALLRFLRGTVVDSLVSFVNPLRPISPRASAVNGITDAMVVRAPAFPDLFPRILDFLGEDTLVFHNAPFDISFLRMEARVAGGEWPENPVIDTLALARRTGLFRNNSLSAICDRLGIGASFHRAEADAYATGKLLLALASGGRADTVRNRAR
ncbi:MAG: 3'-5' exonuclease [Deltaproteobacteria bacterium]|nr:MAG: 3'-5' exonuclease [Deltaproteobacteria bacterium]